MGQATTVASAFTAIILITGIAIMITTSLSTVGMLTKAVEEQTEQHETLINERITMGTWITDASNRIRVNVTNTGETGIRVSGFAKNDVFATYRVSGAPSTSWLPYVQEGDAGSHWRVNRVFFMGSEGDVVNPMKFTSPTHGVWDPNEVIEVEVFVNEAVQRFESVTFITPNGIKASNTVQSIRSGTATIGDNASIVVVSHNLNSIPSAVHVTPRQEMFRKDNYWWVSDTTNTTFTINIAVPGSIIPFYWTVTP